MNVLFVSAEVDPFAKVGGLADVVGSLPQALRQLGIDARVLMPSYGFIHSGRWNIQPYLHFQVFRRNGVADCTLFATEHDGVPVYFLQSWPFFGNESTVYTEWDWDSPRFTFFNQAAIAAVDVLREQAGFAVDLLHVHDWHTGLIPFLTDGQRWRQEWSGVGTMLTIHNMAYQGDHVERFLVDAGIPARLHPQLEMRGLTDNFLAAGIAFADVITTVSPRYAIEIQYAHAGFGLEGLLRTRVSDLHGIVNGLDVSLWNPETDPTLASNYSAADFETKRPPNKLQLQREMGLPERNDVPLIGLVSRLVWQKGIDLLIPAMRGVLAGQDVQFVALGSGEPQYNDQLASLERDFPGKARAYIGFNAAVAERIYAGSDFFVMPSHFEPCGVGQLIAMRYGSLPIVRETGGLADTVINYDGGPADTGTGFVFSWEQSEALYNTIIWALNTYRSNPGAIRRMQRRAMETDFSWNEGARQYAALYEDAVRRHRP